MFVDLPPDLQVIQRRWRALEERQNGRTLQDAVYAREFGPRFAPLFAELPMLGWTATVRPRALASVLGLSWQPVALMGAWCRPERMLILGTAESLAQRPAGEDVIALVARVSGVPSSRIETNRVAEVGEVEIYRGVRRFLEALRSEGIGPRQVLIDMTGGKKSMSASAALAGFISGCPLAYVDYGEYDSGGRIPVAGTEYPRLLRNPLEELGHLERRDVFAAFTRSDFGEAERLAWSLAQRLYEPREPECLAKLAKGYAQWDAFQFRDARRALDRAMNSLDRFADQGGWRWARAVRMALPANLEALHALEQVGEQAATLEAGLPLLLWYLAAADRLLAAGKLSLATMLSYAAVERYIDLCLWVDFHLNDLRPDYGLVRSRLDLSRYESAGRALFGPGYQPQEPDGPLMFGNGAQLLAALDPGRLGEDDLPRLGSLAQARNRCEYEHGFVPRVPGRDQVKGFVQTAEQVVAHICGGVEELHRRLAPYCLAAVEEDA